MFSGNTGAVVVSGGGLATTAPTYELARDARNVIRGLPAALYEVAAARSRLRAAAAAPRTTGLRVPLRASVHRAPQPCAKHTPARRYRKARAAVCTARITLPSNHCYGACQESAPRLEPGVRGRRLGPSFPAFEPAPFTTLVPQAPSHVAALATAFRHRLDGRHFAPPLAPPSRHRHRRRLPRRHCPRYTPPSPPSYRRSRHCRRRRSRRCRHRHRCVLAAAAPTAAPHRAAQRRQSYRRWDSRRFRTVAPPLSLLPSERPCVASDAD